MAAAELHLKSWRCANGHSFDRSKEGYINLLAVNHKRSREPGDSAAMLQARRRHLNAGHYQQLADCIVAMLPHAMGMRLLDIGCGEGYYTRRLEASGWPADALAGIDIAKVGVRLAAKRQPSTQFVVASNYHLPVLHHSVERLLRIFAPGPSEELQRVLKPGGILLDVSPGPEHLWSLKTMLYSHPELHTAPKLIAGFSLLTEERCCFPIAIRGHQAVSDLLAMTPFAWAGSIQAKTTLQNCESLNLEADFIVRKWYRDT